jgi:hypothetical protein
MNNFVNNFCLHPVGLLGKQGALGERSVERSRNGSGSLVTSTLTAGRRKTESELPVAGFSTRQSLSFPQHPITDSGTSLIRNMTGPALVGAGVNGARGRKTPRQARRKTNSLIKRRLRFSFSLFSLRAKGLPYFFWGGLLFSVVCFSFSYGGMDINYTLRKKTDGANPFRIFEGLSKLDPQAIAFGIKRMAYQDFLNSAYWFAVSSVAKATAKMRCQVCNSGHQISTHHRTYDTHGFEHLNMVDLVVLCSNCHGLFHGHLAQAPTNGRKAYSPKIGRHFVVPHEPVVVPEDDPIVLTMDLINDCRANGSFTNATLRAFGMTRRKMTVGWIGRLVGTAMSNESYRLAAEGRFIYRDNPIPVT